MPGIEAKVVVEGTVQTGGAVATTAVLYTLPSNCSALLSGYVTALDRTAAAYGTAITLTTAIPVSVSAAFATAATLAAAIPSAAAAFPSAVTLLVNIPAVNTAYPSAVTLSVNIPTAVDTGYGTTINEDLDSAETGVDVVSDASIEVNDIILIDLELMKVTAKAANVLTVIRGVAGSSAGTHTNGASILQSGFAFVYTSAADDVEVGDIILVDTEMMAVTLEDTANNILTVVRATAGSTAATHAAAAAVTQSATGLTYTSAGDNVEVSDIIVIDAELLKVTALDTVNNVLGVVRAMGGTAAAAHAAAAAVTQSGTVFVYTSTGDPIIVDKLITVESEIMKVTVVDTVNNVLTVLRAMAGTAAAAHALALSIQDTGGAFVYTSAGDAAAVNDIIRIDSETMTVTAEDTVNNVLNVTRFENSVTHAAAAAVLLVSGTNSVDYIVTRGVKRSGAGGATLVGAADIITLFEDAGLAAATVSFAVSGNDILLQVTGIAATTVEWTAFLSLYLGQP